VEEYGACRPARKRGYNRDTGRGAGDALTLPARPAGTPETGRLTGLRIRTGTIPKHREEEPAWT